MMFNKTKKSIYVKQSSFKILNHCFMIFAKKGKSSYYNFGAWLKVGFVLSILLIVSSISFAAEKKQRTSNSNWISHEKIRMGWGTSSAKSFKKMLEAGMNSVMPRLELGTVIDYKPEKAEQPISKSDAVVIKMMQLGSREAKRLGLRYFHCLDLAADRQTFKIGFKNNPARFNDGTLPSPVDPVYWQRAIFQRVQRALDLLDDASVYALDGVIIDPEMYALSGAVPGGADYGSYAFQTFLKETNQQSPSDVKSIAERKRWLQKNQLHKSFIKWQFNRIASMGRELRQLVHSRRPEAILGFIIYKDRLWFNALAKGLATSNKPIFIGPESTYSGVMNESFIKYMRSIRKAVGVPCLLVPGIRMGIENGKIPYKHLEVLKGNIYNRCRYSDGYWVWAMYRFGKTKKQQSAFYNVLSQVNAGLDYTASTGKVDTKLKAQSLSSSLPKGFLSLLKQAQLLTPLSSSAISENISFKAPQLRGSTMLVMWPNKHGKQDTLTIRVQQLGNYLDQGNVRFFDQNGRLLWADSVARNTSKIFRIPKNQEMCIAIISAGQNAYRIEKFSCPTLLISSKGVSLNAKGEGGRFFFFVPEGKKNFTLRLSGHPIEMANYTLYDSTGKVVKRWKKLSRRTTETIVVTEPGIWSMHVSNMIDDAGFGLVNLPNIFALRAKDLRRSK